MQVKFCIEELKTSVRRMQFELFPLFSFYVVPEIIQVRILFINYNDIELERRKLFALQSRALKPTWGSHTFEISCAVQVLINRKWQLNVDKKKEKKKKFAEHLRYSRCMILDVVRPARNTRECGNVYARRRRKARKRLSAWRAGDWT